MFGVGLVLLIGCGFGLLLLAVHALLYVLWGSPEQRDAKRRNRRYEVRDWTPWWRE